MHDVLATFRSNTEKLRANEDTRDQLATPIEDLFRAFARSNPTEQDMVDLLSQMCAVNAHCWDDYAHLFL